MGSARVLFAGGCQTDGYPIGRERALTAVAIAAASAPVQAA
jgi:hypothetical protein